MLRRKKERGTYDKAVVDAILDEGLLCHVGFWADGSTFVMPMAYARIGETLYLHGATGNRMLRSLADDAEVCVTVTLLDALVLARSAFHHSMNYRSVMLFGVATRVDDDDEKRRATIALLDHVAPGRSADVRPPSLEELRAVLMIRVPISEGSAKVRTGGPIDEADDMGEPIWAGHIPVSIVTGAAVPDEGIPPGVREPSYVRAYPARGAGPGVGPTPRPRPGVTQPGG
jgi:nitroimidazol reductase NimA-like FMN-containing flavoprotein (pyridoxamine 5'-phosphate oxidase superfamily)